MREILLKIAVLIRVDIIGNCVLRAGKLRDQQNDGDDNGSDQSRDTETDTDTATVSSLSAP